MPKSDLLHDELTTFRNTYGPVFPEGISLLGSNYDSWATLVKVGLGRTVLVHETCDYSPMCLTRTQEEMFKDQIARGDYPFQTEGVRTYADLGTMKFFEQSFNDAEGSIQGIVYALGAIHDGNAQIQKYRAYVEHVISADIMHADKKKRWSDNDPLWNDFRFQASMNIKPLEAVGARTQ